MVATRTYPPGVPCWIDLELGDPEAARHFYGRLLDWTFESPGDGEYHVAHLAGVPVAAIGPAPDGVAGAGRWNTYVAVDDVQASARAVVEAGGTVDGDPVEVGVAGTLARCVDPTGARFRLWQAGTRAGVQAVNVPGAWNFSDLHTPDPDAALAFYEAVFGWEAKGVDAGAGEWATLLRVPGYGEHLRATADPTILERHAEAGAPEGFSDGVGWIAPLQTERDEPHWHVTLLVLDRDATTSTAQRLGAEIVFERDTRWNRSALIVDSQGARFTVSQFSAAV